MKAFEPIPSVFFADVLSVRMASIDKELEAARAAKAVIDVLLTTPTPKSAVLSELRKANTAAVVALGSGGALNEARANVGITLSNVMHGPPTPEKIDKAKSAIDAWIKELEAAKR
jgi:nucleotide-binding universal stress UspA family protein